MKTITLLGLLLVLTVFPLVLADNHNANLDVQLDPADRQRFDEILQPVVKIYTFVKYISTLVAAIFLLYAGISYMSSGADPRKRDMAKNIAAYVIIGLLVIWAAPLVVDFLI